MQFDPFALALDRWRAVSALDRMGKLARLEHQALRRAECSSEITAAREARDRAAARQEEAACLALATLRSCTQPLDKDLALAMHLSNIEEEERRSVLWRQLPDDVIEHVLKLMDLKRRHQLVIKACKEGIEFQLERQVRASRSVCRRRLCRWNHPTLGALALAPWTLEPHTHDTGITPHTRVSDMHSR